MRIQIIENVQFGALVRLKNPEEVMAQANQMLTHMDPKYRPYSAAASSTSSGLLGAGVSTSGSGVCSSATGFDVLGTAFSADAVGIDSFGIVPSAMAKITPYVTPASAESSAQHPAILGTMFSGLGAWLHKHFRVIDARTSKKIPS